MNMVAATHPRVRVEIVFDFVCPWCAIGIDRLVSTLSRRNDVHIEWQWRSFLLNPTFPPEGMSLESYLRIKQGDDTRIARLLHLIEKQAREFDTAIHFDRICKVPATLNAHRLLTWASARGDATSLVLGLFEAFFRRGEDIGDPVVLAHTAERHGFDPQLVLQLLAGQTLSGTVLSEQSLHQRNGINGVPSIIIAGMALTGVHDSPVIDRLLDVALQATYRDGIPQFSSTLRRGADHS